ncbi:unnamed protein product [Rotaria magnacalcarata]|uniref:Uncharacterized protein n=3 Tax=Rotaria magnacalcarata TaxID=392030 RepID=A0A816TXU9_9BILA|nr:unnamed protein product [Rotaria magnacalcarata]CAF1679212.1 unnamed protein product [Rotaria magnacalcarata]CAF2106874.1 unnamed protein product [Rotaria magnacalcarata]
MRQKPTTAKATVKSVKRAGHHSCQPRQNSERKKSVKVTHVTHYPSQLGHSMSQMSRHHTDLKKRLDNPVLLSPLFYYDQLSFSSAKTSSHKIKTDSLDQIQHEKNSVGASMIQSSNVWIGTTKEKGKNIENKEKELFFKNPLGLDESAKYFQTIKQNKKYKHRRRRLCCFNWPWCCAVLCFSLLLFLIALASLLVFLLTRNGTATTVQRRQLQLQQQQRRQQQQRQQPLHRQPLRPRRQVTTTATTTTVTTPVPPCTPTSVGTASTLFSATSASSSSYQCEAFAWTSPTTGTVTLSFFLRHDPTTWFLDDVSVYYGAVQMLSNGGFESGSMAPWVRSLPNGPCTGWSSAVSTTVYGVLPHSGNYYYIDGSYGCADEISQSFGAIAGEEYIVSFWIQSGSSGSGVSVTVTLS